MAAKKKPAAKKAANDGSATNEPAYLEHCPDCAPYPLDFPQTCLPPVLNALRGQIDDAPCLAHCAWTIQGWVFSNVFGEHVHEAVPSAGGAGELSREEAAQHLETLQAEGVHATAIPWRAILAVVLQLLQELLRQPA